MVVVGDCLELAKSLADDSVDCCVTSPPYWGLRDYGTPLAWGLEPTLAEYLERLGALFCEIRRALKPTGTLWLNMGDSYAASGGGSSASEKQLSNRGAVGKPNRRNGHGSGLKPKDLIGQPWRVAFMLQEQGWYLRSEIIWRKPSCMPESVKDRPTRCHEKVFFMSKSQAYYYDAEAIAEPVSTVSLARVAQPNYENQAGSGRANGGAKTNGKMKAVLGRKGSTAVEGEVRSAAGAKMGRGAGWRNDPANYVETRNARDVWDIAAVGFEDAHFAVFPPELPTRCIKAGCPLGGLVLDPFCGSGTTGMVASQLGRRFVGFEINEKYAEMARRRIASVTPSMFTEQEEP